MSLVLVVLLPLLAVDLTVAAVGNVAVGFVVLMLLLLLLVLLLVLLLWLLSYSIDAGVGSMDELQ